MTLDLPWTSCQLDHLSGSAQVERDGDEVQVPGETGRDVSGRRAEALTLPTVDHNFQGGGHEALETGHEGMEAGTLRRWPPRGSPQRQEGFCAALAAHAAVWEEKAQLQAGLLVYALCYSATVTIIYLSLYLTSLLGTLDSTCY